MNQLDLAWAAGFFDGEGHTFSAGGRSIRLQIQQRDGEVLYRFKEAVSFGTVSGPAYYPSQRGKPLYTYRCSRRIHSLEVLKGLWPYLGSIKKAQALLVVKPIDQGSLTGLS